MNDMINNFQIVVARYNENISWLNNFKNITLIYNKGNQDKYLNDYNVINLPNFGRESHTFLYHIINNYDNLKEYTIFFQGSLKFDKVIKHSPLNIETYFQINDFNAKLQKVDFNILKHPINHFGRWKREYDTGLMKKSNYTCYSFLKNFLDIDDANVKYIDVAWSAVFSIHKSIILKKPKIFYEHLIRFVDYHPNPEEGHFFERSWHFIFHNKHLEKNIIDVQIFKKQNLKKMNNNGTNYHLWITNNYYNLNYEKINDIILSPNYFYKINKYTFDFSFVDNFYIKIKINDDYNLSLVLSHSNEFNFMLLNNNIIDKINNNLNKFINNFNLIIDFNIIKIFINNNIFAKFDLNNIKDSEIFNIENINIYLKSSTYSNNIKFTKNYDNIKFIIKLNEYYDIKAFYKNNFLDNYINYNNL